MPVFSALEGLRTVAPGKRSAARGYLETDEEPWRGDRKHLELKNFRRSCRGS